MVDINLVPEMVIQAQIAHRRVRNLLLLLCTVGLASIGAVVGRTTVSAFRDDGQQSVHKVAAELEALRTRISARRRDIGRYELHFDTVDSMRASQSTLTERLACIPSLIPPHATLSSLQLNQHQLVLTGVASERTVVGDLVSNLRGGALSGEVSVERLKDVSVERHVLQEFLVRAVGLSKNNQEAGITKAVAKKMHSHE